MKTIELLIGKTSDYKNGEMKACVVNGENKVLISRINDKFYAVGATCPHYGAPLEEGLLAGGTLICPWHHSCFNIRNGDLEEPPTFNSLSQFDLEIRGEDLVIHMPDEFNNSRSPNMTKPDEKDQQVFIIIGGGAAGSIASFTLREAGYKGKIIMITRESRIPYDRPNLSKDYLAGHAQPEWMSLCPSELYKEFGIHIIFNKEVVELNSSLKRILFSDGNSIIYDKVLIASGGIPRLLDLPGVKLKNIFVLRSFDDCDNIIEAASSAKSIVIIGGSFIGMETAISLLDRTKASVSIIMQEEYPFVKAFGEKIGKLFKEHHLKKGIKFYTGHKPTAFEGDDFVRNIVLDNGEKIDASLVLLGVGVTPAVSFISDISTENTNGGIKTDNHFLAAPDVYAAGDIAYFPDPVTGEYTRIEHWRTALQMGRTAAFNMAGKDVSYQSIPFFWTRQGDISLIYVGHASSFDDIIYDGDPGNDKEFIAFYVKNNKVVAALGNKEKEMAAINELMRRREMPSPYELKKEKINLIDKAVRNAAV